MNYIYVIDNCLDDREFRNLVNMLLVAEGFISLGYDDDRISDGSNINDNDIIVKKDNKKYTVQTFLNKKITTEEIQETLEDIKKENVAGGIIITNTKVTEEVKKQLSTNNIKIWDRNKLIDNTKKEG